MLSRNVSKNVLFQVSNQIPESLPVLKHFLMCMEIPRPSSNLSGITEKLRKFVETHKDRLSFHQDAIGNVVIRKRACRGQEDVPGVIVQCHMDMVSSKRSTSTHNFETDPIEPVLGDDGYLRARDTTLGADNGIGIAACLALLEEDDSEFTHGPLECLFTVDEETTMAGAQFLDPNLVNGSLLINVDSEEEERICVGCAGGFERKLYLQLERANIPNPNVFAFLECSISGLSGGHTGIDIHRNIPNAIKEIASILLLALSSRKCEGLIVSLNGGNAVNAIPRSAEVVIAFPRTIIENMKEALKEAFDQRLGSTKSTAFQMQLLSATPDDAFTAKSSLRTLEIITSLPHGVLKYHDGHNSVESSVSMSLAQITNQDELECHLFCRADSDIAMDREDSKLISLCETFNLRASDRENYFPGWPRKKDNALEELARTLHSSMFNVDPQSYVVHAGLECGFIKKNLPHVECISIGPRIDNAHSPDEQLRLDTIDPFFRWLKAIIAGVCN